MLPSDPQAIQSLSSFQRLMIRNNARKQWDAENPKLAADWAEAMQIEHDLTVAAERQAARNRLELDMPRVLRKLGVQPEHADGAARKLEDRPSLVAARRFIMQPRPARLPALFLADRTNTGKTQAAVMVLADWARNYSWNTRASGEAENLAVFAKASELASINRFADNGEYLERLKRCPVLVLDDVGTEASTGPGAALLYELVDARYGARRRTVVTTNLGTEQLKRDYDERLLRRLRDMSVCLIGGTLYEAGKRVDSPLKAVRP